MERKIKKYRILTCQSIADYDGNRDERETYWLGQRTIQSLRIHGPFKEILRDFEKYPIKLTEGLESQSEQLLQSGYEPFGVIYKIGDTFVREFIKYED